MSAVATPHPESQPQAAAPAFDPFAIENTRNPFARNVAGLRRCLVERLKGRFAELADALIDKAVRGDLTAAKLVLAYGLGKPAAAVDPDRLDLHEGQLYQEEGYLAAGLDQQLRAQVPGMNAVLIPTRVARPLRAPEYLRAMLAEPPAGPEVTGRASCGQEYGSARPAHLDPERWPADPRSGLDVPSSDILGHAPRPNGNYVDLNVVNAPKNGRCPTA